MTGDMNLLVNYDRNFSKQHEVLFKTMCDIPIFLHHKIVHEQCNSYMHFFISENFHCIMNQKYNKNDLPFKGEKAKKRKEGEK